MRPPRIAATPAQMECRLDQVVALSRGINTLFIGEVVAFHLSPEVYDGKRVDSVKLRPLARLGGPFYAALGEDLSSPYAATAAGRRGRVAGQGPGGRR